MFDAIKTLYRNATQWVVSVLDRAFDRLTCHHALYGYLAVTYYAGCACLIDKDTVAQIATAIYFALSARG